MNKLQSDLLAASRGKISAARDLLRLGYIEDAISRAYYAMFYVAQAFLEGEGLRFSSHAAVVGEFGRVFAKTGRVPAEFHSFLRDAQEGRLDADYEVSKTPSAEEAAGHIENAERFLKLAEDVLGAPEKPGNT